MDHELTVTGLSFGYRDTRVLHEVTLPPVRSGEVTALIGPNAAGKSTLLRCIAGLHRTSTGRIHLRPATTDGPLETIRSAARASRPLEPDQAFYLPQESPPASSLSVFEAVLMARAQATRRRGAAARAAERDTARALTALNLDGLAARPIAALSGGQRQLVGLAQAVVRRPALLLLDEPTSNLDLRNQLRILALIRQLATHQPAAVLVTIHDLNHTARFADNVVILHNGTVHAAGPPHEVITPAMLRAVYKVDGHVHHDQNSQLTVTAHRGL